MLRPRQQLGFSLSDIPIVGPLVSDIGKLAKGDICGAIPVNLVPGMKDLVSRVGCTTAGRDALAVYLTAQGGPVVGAVGVGTMVSCLCSGKLGPGPGIPPPQPVPSFLSSPLTWIGLSAVVLALVVAKSSKKGGGEARRVTQTTATTTYAPTETVVGVT